MSQATDENVNVLLTKILQDKYCGGEHSDFEACIQHYVPQKIENSYVDMSLQRKGLRKCEPYKDVLQKCMQDEKKQQTILHAAAGVPQCKNERNLLAQCQRSKKDCGQEARELLFCGLVNIVQRRKKQDA